jgi:hypothetical protein
MLSKRSVNNVDPYEQITDRLNDLAATLFAVSTWLNVQQKTPYANG